MRPGWLAWVCCLGCAPRVSLPPHTVHPSAADALAVVWADDPLVVGVGERHSKEGGPAVLSTLLRFEGELLPAMVGRASDLVFESWRVEGQCGAIEQAVAAQVAVDTRRPASVGGEVVRVARRARELGLTPHTLGLSCEEHEALLQDGAIDYGRLLRLLTDKLGGWGEAALRTEGARVLLYGGAVHNDLAPEDGLEHYSYGPRLRDALGGRFVELDLVVPEIAAQFDEDKSQPWWPLVDRAGAGQTVLVQRGERSWVLILARGADQPNSR